MATAVIRSRLRLPARVCLALCLCASMNAHAVEEIPPAYRLAARKANVPAVLLYAVALQESGMRRDGRFVPWPWTLNVAGTARRFENHSAACRGLTQALRTVPPTRIDAGLAQINLGYQRHRYRHPCELLDPWHNLNTAAAILREQYRPGESWLDAAKRYHRPAGGAPAARYRQGVKKHLARLLQTPSPKNKEFQMTRLSHILSIAFPVALASSPVLAQTKAAPLIVVEDHGGKPAQPYYQDLHPLSPDKAAPARPLKRGEAGMLPVRSARLSPGREMRRALRMPGWMKPVFLIGDDEESRRWLKAHAPRLKAMGAVGLVVQVETVEALARLRALAGLPLSPVSGDDLAERLNLRHYPVLISAAGIEP